MLTNSEVALLAPEEHLTDEFYCWEVRGRGWQVWDVPVLPEPPFRPFLGHTLSVIPTPRELDDARKPTFIGSLVERLRDRMIGETAVTPPHVPDVEEPLPDE